MDYLNKLIKLGRSSLFILFYLILFNLINNKKIIYEINGELCLLPDIKNKSNWTSFCDFNDPFCPNEFITYDNSSIKYYNLNIIIFYQIILY